MNIEARQRLIGFLKSTRKRLGLSQRAYGNDLGVSATAVQDWEKGDSIPEMENLKAIAKSGGYTLHQLLNYLEGEPLPPSDVDQIVARIHLMPPADVAVIMRAATDRLAAAAQCK